MTLSRSPLRRTILLTVSLSLVASAVSAQALVHHSARDQGGGPAAPAALVDCTETFLSVAVPPENVEGRVPAGFTVIGTTPGTADVWQVMSSCQEPGRGPTTLVMTGVAVSPPAGSGVTVPVLDLHMSLLWALTDDAALAQRLRLAGAPVQHLPRLRFERCLSSGCAASRLTAPFGQGWFQVTATKELAQAVVPPHQHDTVWWYAAAGAPRGRVHLQHELSRERMQDGRLEVQPGTPVSEVFGGSASGLIGVQHGVNTTVTAGPG